MGIFGKLAYEQGATVGTLLAVRFAAAAALFWGLVLATGAGGRLRTLPRRDSARARARRRRLQRPGRRYFAALERLDASLLSLLLYTFPAMVTVAAIALGRERASRRTAGALVARVGGLVLVLAGAGAGRSIRVGTRSGSRPRSSTRLHPHLGGVAERVGPLAAQRARLHRRGATLTIGRPSRATCTRPA
jgi:drug/metabolite transporter (DMT)-like permease